MAKNLGDKVMLNNHAEHNYETSYKFPFVITQYWTNGMVTLQYGATKNRYNIRCINPHKYYANVEDINPEADN